MARPEKVAAVAEIKERLEGARAVFLAEYAGLSVKEQQELRRSLRAGGAEFKIVKMTLARRAAAELDMNDLDDLLLGPTGMTFADRDAVEAAKALKDFAAAHEALKVKGGLLGRDFLTPERVSELADIEPRDVLLAKLAGAFQAPMAQMAGLLAALPRNMASAISQLLEKKESAAPEAAAAPPADVEPEAATEVEPEAEAASESEPEPESATEVEPEAEAASESEPEPESGNEVEPEAEAASESEPEPGSATDVEPEAEAESEPETATDAEPDAAATAADDATTTETEDKASASEAPAQAEVETEEPGDSPDEETT